MITFWYQNLFLLLGDPNDCSANPNACEHICHTHNDSYYCTCYTGYRLASNGRTCVGKLPYGYKILRVCNFEFLWKAFNFWGD